MAGTALLPVPVDHLLRIAEKHVKDLRAVFGVKKEIKNLSSKLRKIRETLDDAEGKRFKEKSFKLWLEDLQSFCYKVVDVLDEWNTRSLRQQMQRSDGVADPGRCCSFLLDSSRFHFKRSRMHLRFLLKLRKLDSALDRVTKEKDQLKYDCAVTCDGLKLKRKRATTSFDVEASDIRGRDIDASALISKLVPVENAAGAGAGAAGEEGNGLPVVISIVGPPGIGKTALAQLVYDNEQIKAHFKERLWVCASEACGDDDEQTKIAKGIVEVSTKSSANLSERLQVLLETIQTTLSGKTFLLVLDDMWADKYKDWEPFKNCLKGLGKNCPGSRILVTTRSERVARMMASVYLHRMQLITDSDAWLLLSSIAFSGRSSSSREGAYSEKLIEIGQKIARHCKGLPLAVVEMGALLCLKNTDEKEWQSVLSKLDIKFSNVEEVETNIFPHFDLSCDDLTPEMKRCFLYCAVFSKNYQVVVDMLIRMWMALGYLTTTNGTSDQYHNEMEQQGREIFENLAMRSLFQDLEKDDTDSNIVSCKVHDIMHDFLEFQTKNECYSFGGGHEDNLNIGNLRHLSWQKTGRTMDPGSICGAIKKLHSFFAENLSPEQLTPKFFKALKSVRVLGLHGCKLQKIPNKIGKLLHVRYIDLSFSKVEELPDSICSLDNLQTLDLRGCDCLSSLPERIGNMRCLRYIDVSGSKIAELPNSICSLANLQTLVLGGCKNLRRLPEGIGKMSNLRVIDISWSSIEELPNSINSSSRVKIIHQERDWQANR